jgi:hypothetical protein
LKIFHVSNLFPYKNPGTPKNPGQDTILVFCGDNPEMDKNQYDEPGFQISYSCD